MDKKQVPNHMKAYYETLERYRQEQNIMVLYKLGLISALDVWVKFKELDIKLRNMFGAVIVLFLMGCAGGSGDSKPNPTSNVVTCAELAGTYDNQLHVGHTMNLNSSCQLTDSLCGYNVIITEPNRTTGEFILTVIDTNRTPGCMSSTAHNCDMEVRGNEMGVSCDNGSQLFSFKKR